SIVPFVMVCSVALVSAKVSSLSFLSWLLAAKKHSDKSNMTNVERSLILIPHTNTEMIPCPAYIHDAPHSLNTSGPAAHSGQCKCAYHPDRVHCQIAQCHPLMYI